MDYEVELMDDVLPSRRDLFAAAALVGLLAREGAFGYAEAKVVEAAADAVLYADALIAALDQPKGET